MKKIIALTLIACATIGGVVAGNNKESKEKAVEQATGLNIGDKAPELNFKSPDGKEIALSSLKGNLVLIDFWASWCGPCRRENPAVVAAYKKYQKATFKSAKGFKIYSVSLDKDPNRWKQAITQDKLEWKEHVSDLGAWGSQAAKTYRVNSIPMNWLIDENGVIIAKNLRGHQLDMAIDKYVKEFK